MKITAIKILVLICTIVIFTPFSFAQSSRITVSFEQSPLFSRTNFVPGETETRFIKVTNNTETEKEVILQANNFSECRSGSCLAKALVIKIYSGSDIYFEKTLDNLFQSGEISLGNLSAGTTKEYDISLFFSHSGDNNIYKKNTTGFDILVGFNGEVVKNYNNGAVLGSGTVAVGQVSGLVIEKETAQVFSDGTVVITWTTSEPSSGQVVYGLDVGIPYRLDLTKSNFGYPESTASDFFKTEHSFTFSHLPSGKYRYRVASRNTSPTISYEHMFTVNRVESGKEYITIRPSLQNFPQKKDSTGLKIERALSPVKNIIKNNPEKNTSKENTAFAFFGIKNLNLIWLLGLLTGTFLLWFLSRKK